MTPPAKNLHDKTEGSDPGEAQCHVSTWAAQQPAGPPPHPGGTAARDKPHAWYRAEPKRAAPRPPPRYSPLGLLGRPGVEPDVAVDIEEEVALGERGQGGAVQRVLEQRGQRGGGGGGRRARRPGVHQPPRPRRRRLPPAGRAAAARRPLRRFPRLRGEVGARLGAEVLQDPQRVLAGPARGGAGRRGRGRRAGTAGPALGPPALQPRQQVDHDVHGAGDEEHHEDQHPELADQEHFHGRGG